MCSVINVLIALLKRKMVVALPFQYFHVNTLLDLIEAYLGSLGLIAVSHAFCVHFGPRLPLFA